MEYALCIQNGSRCLLCLLFLSVPVEGHICLSIFISVFPCLTKSPLFFSLCPFFYLFLSIIVSFYFISYLSPFFHTQMPKSLSLTHIRINQHLHTHTHTHWGWVCMVCKGWDYAWLAKVYYPSAEHLRSRKLISLINLREVFYMTYRKTDIYLYMCIYVQKGNLICFR